MVSIHDRLEDERAWASGPADSGVLGGLPSGISLSCQSSRLVGCDDLGLLKDQVGGAGLLVGPLLLSLGLSGPAYLATMSLSSLSMHAGRLAAGAQAGGERVLSPAPRSSSRRRR